MSAPESETPPRHGETPEEEVIVPPASPGGIRLAGATPKVMRLSPKAIIASGGVAFLAIGGALWWGLGTKEPDAAENVYESANASRSELVTGGPADYGKVKLTAPAPGELGAPTVPQDGEMMQVSPPALPQPADAAVTAADQREARAAQEREAARASRLFLGGAVIAESRMASDQPSLASAPPTDRGSNGRRDFLTASGARVSQSTARVVEAASPNIIQAGSVIPAALITGIRSDLPGQITAQVTQNVYDSPTGRILLIPQGARLIGEYDSEIVAGQSRVLLAWDRLILPGGRSILLDRLPGADAAGMAGLADRTDYHWGHMLKAALVSTLLGIGTELGDSDDDRLVRAIRSGGQDAVSETGRQVVERQLGVPPTLTIRPGFTLRVIVTRDIILDPIAQEDSI